MSYYLLIFCDEHHMVVSQLDQEHLYAAKMGSLDIFDITLSWRVEYYNGEDWVGVDRIKGDLPCEF